MTIIVAPCLCIVLKNYSIELLYTIILSRTHRRRLKINLLTLVSILAAKIRFIAKQLGFLLIQIFGILLTYILFIYQMQDQKQDMSLLPKLEEITEAALRLAHTMTPGMLIAKNCTH